jgi:small-conductance mechanosensitive channel
MEPVGAENTDNANPALSPEAEAFYTGAIGRITALMPVLGVLGTAVLWWYRGRFLALGFVAGGAIAYVNFYWLKRVVHALVERAARGAPRGHTHGVIARFLVRYALIAVAAYAILSFSVGSFHGLLAGLFLPVAAIMCEAAYEAYAALHRGL